MLGQVDLAATISKEDYKGARPEMDIRLSSLQRALVDAGRPVLIVIDGWEAAGVGTVITRILAPMDPRRYKVHNLAVSDRGAKLRPPLWQYWVTVPPRGDIAVYDGSWYDWALRLTGFKHRDACARIKVLERQLVDDGAVVLKFFLHISKKEQSRRFKKMEKNKSQAWMVTKEDWREHEKYEAHLQRIDGMLETTSTPHAPWIPVPAHDMRYAASAIAREIVVRVEAALHVGPPQPSPPPEMKTKFKSPLDKVNLKLSIDPDEYPQELDRLQRRLLDLEHAIYVPRIPVVVVYEGWDASGKGGNIKRLVAGLDHRGFEVIPIGAPTGDEATHHYLWRFWKALPKGGHITIFDRSWYGRVLVERVEGFARPEEWRRAYREIVEFEEELLASGAVLVKFWLHIGKEEQLKRFRQREEIPHKQWKITPDDWRNRRKWDAYYAAVSEMLVRTSTPQTPWTIVEANQKWHARIKALKTVCQAIEQRLGR